MQNRRTLPFLLFYTISFCIILIHPSCNKSEILEYEIQGSYCTYLADDDDHIASSTTIEIDTSEEYDYIISNISGFVNSANFYNDIGFWIINDVIRMPEKEITITNGKKLKVSAKGNIQADGSIHLKVTLVQEEEKTFDLIYSPSNRKIGRVYKNIDSSQLLVNESSLQFSLIDSEDKLYSFRVPNPGEQECDFKLLTQEVENQTDGEIYRLRGNLIFLSDGVRGKIEITSNSFLNATDFHVNMDLLD